MRPFPLFLPLILAALLPAAAEALAVPRLQPLWQPLQTLPEALSAMAQHKIFAGTTLRETRPRAGLTQRAFAGGWACRCPISARWRTTTVPSRPGC